MTKAGELDSTTKGLERAIKKLDAFEAKVNKLRGKGLFPGKPGDPIVIGE